MFRKQFTKLQNACAFAEAIVNTVREPLVVLDQDLRVVAASRSFYRTFKVSPQDTEGKLLYELGDGVWDIAKLRSLLEKILPADGAIEVGERERLVTSRDCPHRVSSKEEHKMTIRLAVIVAAVAGICCAMPAGAEEVGVGVGPVGVTVGSGHRDWDRDHDRDRDRTVIINKDRDRDRDRDTTVIRRDRDHDRGTVVIDRRD